MQGKTVKDTQTLQLLQEETNALSVIRTETALSRFPMHCLAKGKQIEIELKNQGGAVYWNVSHNTKYGQPGQLAYKIDTLIINRRIEETGRPVPKIIKLGTLAEIAQELGSASHNSNSIKQALAQNATASVTAKINYRTHEKGEKWLEAVFNRYSVVFTGETLPNGLSADAVYIVLNDIYQEILNTAVFRPLDYDYMKSLPPAAQRFYEIASYQIYAAVHHNNPRAKLLYSEYCSLSTATRYHDFEQVKKQMYKILRPHVQSGYLAKVSYEPTVNAAGEPDWWMYFSPGVNAGREYQAFTGTKKAPQATHSKKRAESGGEPPALPFEALVEAPASSAAPASTARVGAGESGAEAETASPAETGSGEGSAAADAETLDLTERLVAAELNRGDAERFAGEKPEVCRRQLAFLPYVEKFKTSRGAYLRRAIEGDYGPPAAYAKAQEQQAAAETARRQKAQAAFEAAQEKARQSHEERFYGAYLEYLRERVGETEKAQPEAFTAFQQWEDAERQRLIRSPLAERPMFQATIKAFDAEKTRLERCRDYFAERGSQFLSFWEWDEALNPEKFQV